MIPSANVVLLSGILNQDPVIVFRIYDYSQFFGLSFGNFNPALIHFYANVGCESANGYAMVASVAGMSMTVTNGSTTIYHLGPAGEVTAY